MGSVKDLEIIRKPTTHTMGVGRFRFSDRYSVFDWGEMPDLIKGKGAALCLMGAYCFQKLEEEGLETHYRGLVAGNGHTVKVEEANRPLDTMEIDLVNVYRPTSFIKDGRHQYNYSKYTPELRNFLIPLEIIYRNGLPEGSSVFKRLEKGQITLQDLGLTRYPTPGEKLTRPIFDVSTKLEEKDRYLTWKEAQKIAGMTSEEVDEAKDLLLEVDSIIKDTALKADLENEDGKIELAFDPERRLIVVDVVGTLDECRFTYKDLHVSKEIARQFYRKTTWFNDVEEAQKKADIKGIKDWKGLCKSQPPKLDEELKNLISETYTAAANKLTGRRFFDVPQLKQVLNKLSAYKKTKLEPD